jgi:hypothetical protein
MPVLMPWPGPVGEMKVPHFTLDEHCVMHMHHGKSLHASSIIDLGDVHGVWGRYVGSVLRTKENVRLRSTDLEDLNLQVLGHI